MLHEDGMTIAGIKLDINPITEGKTGTMENYLPAVEKHLEHKASDREKKKSVLKGIKEKCAGAKKSEPAKKKMKDHSSPCVIFYTDLLEFKIKITTITVIEKKKIIMYNTSIEN